MNFDSRSDPAQAVKIARGVLRRPSILQDVNSTLAILRDDHAQEKKFDHDVSN